MNYAEQFKQAEIGLLDKNKKPIREGDIVKHAEVVSFVVRYGKYNKYAEWKNTAPHYVGATFYLDPRGLSGNHPALKPTDMVDVEGVAHLYMPDMGVWEGRMERFHELWGLEIVGSVYEEKTS